MEKRKNIISMQDNSLESEDNYGDDYDDKEYTEIMEKYVEYEKNNNMIFTLDEKLNNNLRNTINNDLVNKHIYSNIDSFGGLNRIQFLIEIQVYNKSHIPYNYLTF